MRSFKDDVLQASLATPRPLGFVEHAAQLARLAGEFVQVEAPPPLFKAVKGMFCLGPDLLRGRGLPEEVAHLDVLRAGTGEQERVLGSSRLGLVRLEGDGRGKVAAGPERLHLESVAPRTLAVAVRPVGDVVRFARRRRSRLEGGHTGFTFDVACIAAGGAGPRCERTFRVELSRGLTRKNVTARRIAVPPQVGRV